MIHRVGGDGVTGLGDVVQDLGIAGSHLADREEDRLGALGIERGEHGRRAVRQRAVVERQHDLFRIEEVVRLVVLEAEAGAAGGVDLDDARDAERIGIAGAVRLLGDGRGRAQLLLGKRCSADGKRSAQRRVGDESRLENCAHRTLPELHSSLIA